MKQESRFLGFMGLSLMAFSGCQFDMAFLDTSRKTSSKSEVASVAVTGNFKGRVVGLHQRGGVASKLSFTALDSKGAPVTLKSGDRFECRTGSLSGVGSATFAACDGTSGFAAHYALREDSSRPEGEYATDVRILRDREELARTRHTYFLSPELDGSEQCTFTKTDDEIFAVAAAMLAPTGQFPSNTTDLSKPPMYKIAGKEIISLHKEVTISSDGNYAMVKRTRSQVGQACVDRAVRLATTHGRHDGGRNRHQDSHASCDALVFNSSLQGYCLVKNPSTGEYTTEGHPNMVNVAGELSSDRGRFHSNLFKYRRDIASKIE